jgi:hypothetical protein
VLYGTFGLDRVKDKLPSPVDVLLTRIPGGLDDSISAKLVLQEEYETMYGIYNHDDPYNQRPLALVGMQPKEDVSRYSKLYRTIRRYSFHEIHSKFGLSLTEFLDLPHDIVELLFEISAEQAQKQQPSIDKTLKDLEKGS